MSIEGGCDMSNSKVRVYVGTAQDFKNCLSKKFYKTLAIQEDYNRKLAQIIKIDDKDMRQIGFLVAQTEYYSKMALVNLS